MAHRRTPTIDFDDEWADDDGDLEAIDPTTGASTRAAPPAHTPATYRRGRRRAWLASAVLTGLCLAGVYGLLSHRAATTMTTAWAQAVSDAEALSTVMEGLRTGAMLADVTGEPQESFVRARQDSVRQMRARVAAQRDAIAGTTPADPRLISLRSRALGHLDMWADEMDAFLARRGLWVRAPEFGRLAEPMEKAAQRWRVDVPPPAPVEISGAGFLARLAQPTDEPLPLVVTALTSNGDRLDIDLLSQTVTRTRLDPDHVALGSVAVDMRIDNDSILVTTPVRRRARLPIAPSSDVATEEGPEDGEVRFDPFGSSVRDVPPELVGIDLPAGQVWDHVRADRSTGIVALTLREAGPPGPSTIAAIDPGTTRPRTVTSLDSHVTAMSAEAGWAVFGVRNDVRMSVRAVHLTTGRVLTVRLPDPYVTMFVVHPAKP